MSTWVVCPLEEREEVSEDTQEHQQNNELICDTTVLSQCCTVPREAKEMLGSASTGQVN